MKNPCLLATVLMLAACTQTTSSGAGCGFAEEFFLERNCKAEEMQRVMHECGTRKTWVDKTQCKRGVITTYQPSPASNEVSAYAGLLIEKVKDRKMTTAQAEYALQQKISEVNQRVDQAYSDQRHIDLIERQQDMQNTQERLNRQNEAREKASDPLIQTMKGIQNRQNAQPAAPVIQSPTTTNCRPDGFGGVTCTTY